MKKKSKITILEIAVFGMLGGVMYASKEIMAVLPNIHLIGTFIVTFTVVYRVKALYPIYVFVFLEGLFHGFSLWWIPYLYIWLPLWGAVMLLPKKMPKWLAPVVYCLVSGLHGLSYGTLYAPFQAITAGLDFNGMLLWIAAGLRFDIYHMLGNIGLGIAICPLIELIRRCNESIFIERAENEQNRQLKT